MSAGALRCINRVVVDGIERGALKPKKRSRLAALFEGLELNDLVEKGLTFCLRKLLQRVVAIGLLRDFGELPFHVGL